MTDVMQVLGKIGHRVDERMLELLAVGASKDFKEVVFHQVKAGGKRIRPALTISFCEASEGNPNDAISAAAVIELIHNYSLILDDIIDDAVVRRNLPTTWKKYSLPFGILASTHYRESIEEGILQSPNPLAISRIVADTIRELVEGERLDVLFEQVSQENKYVDSIRYHEISYADYETMIGYKTASLLRAACEVGVICADASMSLRVAARDFGWKAGIAFQMADDVLDLFAEEEKLGKKVGKDIYEHKPGNAVILQALKLMQEKDQTFVLDVLRTPQPKETEVSKVIKMLKECGAPDKVRKQAETLVKEAKNALEPFPNKETTKILATLVDFIYQRTY